MSKGYLRYIQIYFSCFLIYFISPLNLHAAPKSEFINSLWVAQEHDILKISSVSGKSLFQIQIEGEVQAIDVDQSRALVWLVNERSLLAYDFSGKPQREFLLSTLLPVKETSHKDHHRKKYKLLQLKIDEKDGSLWLHHKKTLWHITASGELLHRFSIKNEIASFTLLHSMGHVWLASKKSIHVYDITNGQLIRKQKKISKSKIKDLAFDKTLNEIWVGGEKSLIRLSTNGEQTYQHDIHHLEVIQPDGKGKLWLATEKTLFYLDASGAIQFQLSPFSGEDNEIEKLVLEPTDQSIWVVGEHVLIHVDTQGVIQQRIQLKSEIEDVALYSDLIAPLLAFVSPIQGSVLNTATPALILQHSDNGIGTKPDALNIDQDGLDLQITCQHSEAISTCTPVNPLEEGLINLSATVKDYVGNTSEKATTVFIVDTISPSITVNSHWNGTYVNQSAQTLSGYLSEFAVLNINNTAVSLGLNHIFSYPVLLFEGQNNFLFEAQDEATNVGTLPFILFLDTVPPLAVEVGKIEVIDVIDGHTTVSGQAGSVEAGATVEITNLTTNVITTIQASADGSLSLTLQANPADQLNIIVIDKANNRSAVSEVKVPLPLSVTITSPLDLVTVQGDSINIEGTYKGPENTGITVNGEVAAIINNKFYINNVNLKSGVNTVTAYLTVPDGTTLNHAVSVTSNIPSVYSVNASPYSGIASLTVNFNINETQLNSTQLNLMQSVIVDFESDGVVDYNSTDLTLPISFTYTLPGKYLATTSVIDMNGDTHTYQNYIIVYEPAALDAKLRSIYTGMLNQLSLGNINNAMKFLTGSMQYKFKEAFINAGAKLADIIPKLGTIHSGRIISDDLAEYVIIRTENGQKVAFAIYLIKEDDGIWRIGEM